MNFNHKTKVGLAYNASCQLSGASQPIDCLKIYISGRIPLSQPWTTARTFTAPVPPYPINDFICFNL